MGELAGDGSAPDIGGRGGPLSPGRAHVGEVQVIDSGAGASPGHRAALLLQASGLLTNLTPR